MLYTVILYVLGLIGSLSQKELRYHLHGIMLCRTSTRTDCLEHTDLLVEVIMNDPCIILDIIDICYIYCLIGLLLYVKFR